MTTTVTFLVCIVADVLCLPSRTLFPPFIVSRMRSGVKSNATYRLVACSVNTMGFSAKTAHGNAPGILRIKRYVQYTYYSSPNKHREMNLTGVRRLIRRQSMPMWSALMMPRNRQRTPEHPVRALGRRFKRRGWDLNPRSRSFSPCMSPLPSCSLKRIATNQS